MEPLTPEGLDLREFGWMPLDVMRLRDSDLVVLSTGEAFRAAVLLWCAAWHQVPAGSLPNDDRLLANLAGYGRDLVGWSAVKTDAMRGFVECFDGRFYHPIVCEKAIEADEQRSRQRKRTQAATAARRNVQRDDIRNDAQNDECNEVHLTLPNPTLPKKIKPAAKPQPGSNDAFERFKASFPKRDGANPWQPAEKKFWALVKTGVDPEVMINGAKALAREEGARGNIGTKFIPQAITWLNQQRFHDVAAAAFSANPAAIDWDNVVSFYKRTRIWTRGVGPDPDSSACEAPPEVLRKHGIQPTGAL